MASTVGTGCERTPRFEFLSFPAGIPRLRELLGEDDGTGAAAKILDLLLSTGICQSAVIERDYICLDYRSSYARFYINLHQDLDKRCTRIHFFRGVADLAALFHARDLAARYLGFVVRRPLGAVPLGRTVLAWDVLKAACSQKIEAYLTCRAKHPVNLAGCPLNADGAPWMAQDSLVAACASISAWVVCAHMSRKFSPEFKHFPTAQITDFATQFDVSHGRAMPSSGLTAAQIMSALKAMGYDPHFIEPEDEADARAQLYHYVESGIPVIIGLEFPGRGGHAVTAVGHTLDRSQPPRVTAVPLTGLRFSRTSDFVPHFIIQDDGWGPYGFLELVSWEDARKDPSVGRHLGGLIARYEEGPGCVAIIDRGKPFERAAIVFDFVVPLPQGVTMDGLAAEDSALSVIVKWYQKAGIQPPLLTLRTFLQTSNELKENWRTAPGMPEDLGWELRSHLFSRWVWITEVSTHPQFSAGADFALGQIIQDSASPRAAGEEFEPLAVHMPPGYLALVEPSRNRHVVPIKPYSKFPIRKRSE